MELQPPRMLKTMSGSLRSQEEVLLEPFNYIGKLPGKGIRPRMIAAFNNWLQVPSEIIEKIADITQKLHNASLMIDDIEDNSKLRRGTPVAHVVYGVPQTLNTANYVYFLALNDLTKLGNSQAVEIFIKEMLNLHRGQGLDIYWRDNSICPTEEEYINMVQNKTGGLFRLSVLLMQCFSSDRQDYIPLVNELGLMYQVMDDYLNLQSMEYHHNKSYCEDLTEGKFSFPIVHSIMSSPGDSALQNILKQRTTDPDVKRYACEMMRASGSFRYTRSFFEQSIQKVKEHISLLGGNKDLQLLVDDLCKLLPPADND
uniref:Geranylgeranyl pyrophosphate synthase n=1 Tax=Guillardia theta TaxID=55529 RepID=A0A6U6BZK5_GUITH|mmetsp:Transcript_42692/g.134503  ORF Transcript_42692/g.134503 Transcript_42692/m.134503 type:complete len:313 (+) Transcript_42692:198-1136(+)